MINDEREFILLILLTSIPFSVSHVWYVLCSFLLRIVPACVLYSSSLLFVSLLFVSLLVLLPIAMLHSILLFFFFCLRLRLRLLSACLPLSILPLL